MNSLITFHDELTIYKVAVTQRESVSSSCVSPSR
jgi:hypothetical protein